MARIKSEKESTTNRGIEHAERSAGDPKEVSNLERRGKEAVSNHRLRGERWRTLGGGASGNYSVQIASRTGLESHPY